MLSIGHDNRLFQALQDDTHIACKLALVAPNHDDRPHLAEHVGFYRAYSTYLFFALYPLAGLLTLDPENPWVGESVPVTQLENR